MPDRARRYPGRLAPLLAALGLRRPGFNDALEDVGRLPNRLVPVDPRRVAAMIDTKGWAKERHAAFVLDGDWDRDDRVDRPIIRRTVEQIFVEGRPYTDSDQFHHMVRIIETGADEWNYRCETLEDIHAYFDRLDTAYRSIRDDGYRTQADLDDGRPGDEIRVYVGRDGQPVAGNGGAHRLEIVRVLGLPEVPMLVRGAHVRWVRRCYDRWGRPLTDAIERGLEGLSG